MRNILILEREEKASKPVTFALKSKNKKKPKVKEIKHAEVFKKENEESGSEGEQDADELDGYRPNKVNNRKSNQENKELSNEEKAKIAMEKAKLMIAEAQKKQEEIKKQIALQGYIFIFKINHIRGILLIVNFHRYLGLTVIISKLEAQ